MRKSMLAVALLLFATLAVSAAPLDLPVTSFTLGNGMQFLVLPRHDLPTVAACIQFRVGTADERPGQTGACSMMERMLFAGTEETGTWNYAAEKPILSRIDALGDQMAAEQARLVTTYGGGDEAKVAALREQIGKLEAAEQPYGIPDDLRRLYRRNGARGLDAATWEDGSCCYVSLPANRLEAWACLEADRMANPVFRDFYRERDALIEQGRRADPDARLFTALQEVAYTASPYRRPPPGWPSDLAHLSSADTQRFFHDWYGPNNAVAVLVGDLEPAEVKALAEKYFAGIPSRPIPLRLPPQDPPAAGPRRVEVVAAARPEVYLGFPGPKFGDGDEFVLDVIAEILSRQRLPATLASRTFAYNYSRRLGNLFVVDGMPQGAHTAADVENALWRELGLLKIRPVTSAALKEAVRGLDADFVRGLVPSMALARQIANAAALTGDWRNFDPRGRWEAVTPAAIMQAARRWLGRDNSAVATLQPPPPKAVRR